MAQIDIKSDINVEGQIKLTTITNATGSLLTYNPTSQAISARTNTEIVSDLNLMTTNTDQTVYGTKYFVTDGGDESPNNRLIVIANDGSYPAMSFYDQTYGFGQVKFALGTFKFTDYNGTDLVDVKAYNFFTDNFGSADQWNQAYQWGDYRQYGLGVTSAVLKTNLNTNFENGLYASNTATSNIPVAGISGSLIHQKSGALGYWSQIYTVGSSQTTPRMFISSGQNTTRIAPWTEVLTTLNGVPYTGATADLTLADKNLNFTSGSLSKLENGARIFNKVFHKYTGTAQTGILSIKFPQASTAATMFDVTIKVYNFQSTYLGNIRIAFYKQSATVIHSTGRKCLIECSDNFPSTIVNVGMDLSGNICINLGDINTVWNLHTNIEVERVSTVYTGAGADWSKGWSQILETVAPVVPTTYQSLVTIPVEILATRSIALQNLSTNTTNAGTIDISGGGTSASLTTLALASKADGNVRSLRSEIQSYYTSSGSTNYPSTIGAGIRVERYSSASDQRGFNLWSAGASGQIYFKTFNGSVSESAWEMFASREWTATKYVPITPSESINAGTFSGDLLNVTLGTYIATVSAGASNLPFGNPGGLISFGQIGSVSTRILGARDNSDNLWFQSGVGTGAWRQLASREWSTANLALTNHTHTFASLTNKPTTIAGYGITDAMSTSHPANGITSTNISNWNTAFGWGNHKAINENQWLGSDYVGGGLEKPNSPYFGAGKLKLQMLSGTNLGTGNSQWYDVLWMSSYAGGDVKKSTAIVSSKNDNKIGFVKQDYDSATWGNYTEFLTSESGGFLPYSKNLDTLDSNTLQGTRLYTSTDNWTNKPAWTLSGSGALLNINTYYDEPDQGFQMYMDAYSDSIGFRSRFGSTTFSDWNKIITRTKGIFTNTVKVSSDSTSNLNIANEGVNAKLVLSNGNGETPVYGMKFGVESNGEGHIQQQRFDGSSEAYALHLQPLDSLVSIRTYNRTTTQDVLKAYGKIAAYGNESNAVKTWISSNALNSIVAGHEYHWYNDVWKVGSKRGGGTGSDFYSFEFSTDQGATYATKVQIDSVYGNISTANYGASNQWYEAYTWGNYRQFGLGTDSTNVVNAADLNTVYYTSIYGINDNTTGNKPFGYGSVWQHKKEGVEYTQMAINVLNGNSYTRGFSSGLGDTGWKKNWNDSDFSQANINSWNTAIANNHTHSNLGFLNNIDQYLGVGQAPQFNSVRLMNSIGYGTLALEEDYIGGELGLIDLTNEVIYAGRVGDYLKYGSNINDSQGLNIEFNTRQITVGKQITNDEDKFQIAGDISVDTKDIDGVTTELILNPLYDESGDVHYSRHAHIYIVTGNTVILPDKPILGQRIEIFNNSDATIEVRHSNVGILFLIPFFHKVTGIVGAQGFIFDENPVLGKKYDI